MPRAALVSVLAMSVAAVLLASDPASGGPRFSLDQAVRELDLIRPGRVKAAEDFSVPTAERGTFRLADHRGKVVLVNFWATWCPPCLEEMPAFERLHRRHREAGLVVVGVALDADPARAAPFARQHALTFAIGLDARARVADLYGVRALPATFVVDRAGNLAYLALGPREWDHEAAHALIEALLR